MVEGEERGGAGRAAMNNGERGVWRQRTALLVVEQGVGEGERRRRPCDTHYYTMFLVLTLGQEYHTGTNVGDMKVIAHLKTGGRKKDGDRG